VLLLGALSVARIWLTGDSIRQWRVVETIVTSIGVVILLVVWLALFSRLPRRTRLVGAAVALAVLALAPALFRVRGVTGDLRPIVEPRFGRSSALPEPAPHTPPAESLPAPGAVAAAPVLQPALEPAPHPQHPLRFSRNRSSRLPARSRRTSPRSPSSSAHRVTGRSPGRASRATGQSSRRGGGGASRWDRPGPASRSRAGSR